MKYTTTLSDGTTYRPRCPNCGQRHHNGAFLNGVDAYRCLGCGSSWLRHHPDADIDAGIRADEDDAVRTNVAVGVADVQERRYWAALESGGGKCAS